jgi:hypothetical protein
MWSRWKALQTTRRCEPSTHPVVAPTVRPSPPQPTRGVLNVVHGTHDVVNAILDHPDIRAVSFVGSDAAGRHVYSRAAASGKRVQVGWAVEPGASHCWPLRHTCGPLLQDGSKPRPLPTPTPNLTVKHGRQEPRRGPA